MSNHRDENNTPDGPYGHWQKPFWGRDIGGALVLISIGVLFLLNTSGVVDWGVWGHILLSFFRLWPLYLILAGLNLIFAGSRLAKVLLSILSWLIFLFILSMAVYTYKNNLSWESVFPSWGLSGVQTSKQILIAEDKYTGVEQLDLNMKVTAGKFNLVDDRGENYLNVLGEYVEGRGEPVVEAAQSGQNLALDFGQKFQDFMGIMMGAQAPSYQMVLGGLDTPTSLKLEMVAGDGKLDLDEVKLTDVNLKMTAGNLDVLFGKTSTPATMQVEVTAGNLDLDFPDSVRVDLSYDLTAGSLEVAGTELTRGSSTHTINPDAEQKLSLGVKLTAGNLTIN